MESLVIWKSEKTSKKSILTQLKKLNKCQRAEIYNKGRTNTYQKEQLERIQGHPPRKKTSDLERTFQESVWKPS